MSTPQSRSLDFRVFGGIAVKIITAGLQFLAIPVIISQAGLETYGLFGIYSIIIIYFATADLGITKSTLRFVSMSRQDNLTDIFSVIFLLTGLFTLLIVGTGFLLATPILNLMSIEATPANRSIYYLALTTSCLFVARSLYISVVYALERFRFAYNTTVAFDILRWGVSIVAVIVLDNALLALLTVLTAATFLHVLTLAWVAHVSHRIRIAIPENGAIARDIVRYSFSVFMIDMMNKISSYADKILVAATGVVVNFAHYYIAFQVVGKISDFLSAATIPYIQSVAKSYGLGDTAAIRTTMTGAFDKVGFLFLPLILSLLVFGETYLSIWLDPATAADVYPYLAILSGGYGLSIYGTLSISLANALGRTSISMLSSGLMAGVILGGGLLALPRYGPLGMSAVWAATQAIPLLIVFPSTMHRLGISQTRLALRAVSTAAGMAIMFLGAKLLAHALLSDPSALQVLAFALTSLALSFAPATLSLLLKRL